MDLEWHLTLQWYLGVSDWIKFEFRFVNVHHLNLWLSLVQLFFHCMLQSKPNDGRLDLSVYPSPAIIRMIDNAHRIPIPILHHSSIWMVIVTLHLLPRWFLKSICNAAHHKNHSTSITPIFLLSHIVSLIELVILVVGYGADCLFNRSDYINTAWFWERYCQSYLIESYRNKLLQKATYLTNSVRPKTKARFPFLYRAFNHFQRHNTRFFSISLPIVSLYK